VYEPFTNAQQRAYDLLLSFLDPHQSESVRVFGRFTEKARNGVFWTIDLTQGYRVHVAREHQGGVCVTTGHWRELPIPDQAVAMLLAIRADPAGFAKTVNRCVQWPRDYGDLLYGHAVRNPGGPF